MLGFGKPDAPEINAQKVFDDIKYKKDVVILDVRTPQELDSGYIESSINVPLQDLTNVIEEKIPDKDKTVYVYCLSGSRSATAVNLMTKLGYKNAFSMKSGILAWRAKEFTLTS